MYINNIRVDEFGIPRIAQFWHRCEDKYRIYLFNDVVILADIDSIIEVNKYCGDDYLIAVQSGVDEFCDKYFYLFPKRGSKLEMVN